MTSSLLWGGGMGRGRAADAWLTTSGPENYLKLGGLIARCEVGLAVFLDEHAIELHQLEDPPDRRREPRADLELPAVRPGVVERPHQDVNARAVDELEPGEIEPHGPPLLAQLAQASVQHRRGGEVELALEDEAQTVTRFALLDFEMGDVHQAAPTGPGRSKSSLLRRAGVRSGEVERDREDQRRRPRVDRVEQQGLVTPDVVGDQPDDEPEDRHSPIVACAAAGRIGSNPRTAAGNY